MPEFAENADEAPSYEKTKEFEVFVLQRVAPLVEGSTLSKEALLEQVTVKMASLEIPVAISNLIYDPEELLSACFTMQQTMPKKIWSILDSMTDIDSSTVPRQSW